jgi:hypothetical protein
MFDLSFHVESAEPVPFSAAPLLAFKLAIGAAAEGNPSPRIQSISLRCQIRIEPARRHYSPAEQAGLLDLFGEPHRWNQTLRSLLWTHTSLVVPPFEGTTLVDLPVPCTFDFTIAVTKYFYSLEEGKVPISLLFSGSIFHEGEDGLLEVAQIPWDREAHFQLPVDAWRGLMDLYYPNSAWLSVRRDVFDRLYHYKSRHGLPTWEEALDRLLQSSEQ